MKLLKVFIFSILLMILAGGLWAQDTLYYEFFTDGTMNLNWFTPWEGGNNMEVDYWEGNPSGDCWVGLVGNELSGGGVGTALSGEMSMTDYEIEAQIYCTVDTGTYHAVVARWDTSEGMNKYYYFRSDFDSDQRLQLRKFPGESGFGETIAEWTGAQIPGGVPTTDSWHPLKLKCEANQLWVYYDGVELEGCPFTDSYSSYGFFGVYVFNMMSTAETYCDDIVVMGEGGIQPIDLIAQSNVFLNENFQVMTLRPAEGQTVYFKFYWDAVNGEEISPPFTIILEIDDTEIFSSVFPGAEPNTSYSLFSNSWTAVLGEHTLRWTLDTDNTVPEGNEDNNILEEEFMVVPTTAYDFQADSAWVADTDTIEYEDNPVGGDEVLFPLFWSVPMGEGASGAFNILMELDGEQYYLETIFGVTSGENYVTTAGPWTATEGFHYFSWAIDADNWVDEFNENNNFIMDGFDVDPGGSVEWGDTAGLFPKRIRISDVFPNPFNPSVTLRYENSYPGMLKLVIYDVNGREVATLFEGYSPAGIGEVTWKAEGLASGTYFAVLSASGDRSVQPLLFVK